MEGVGRGRGRTIRLVQIAALARTAIGHAQNHHARSTERAGTGNSRRCASGCRRKAIHPGADAASRGVGMCIKSLSGGRFK